jgi:hypothetical protein
VTQSENDTLDHGTLMLGYLCIKDVDGLSSQVEILDRFGLSDKDIAAICAAAVGSVRNARVEYKRPKKGSKKGRA